MTQFDKTDVLTPKKVQELLGLSKTTVAELLHSAKIKSQRGGRKYLISRKADQQFVDGE